jgi:hypothetical protein
MANIFDANSADLSAFQAHGGKLIMFMGWEDPVGSPFEAINYYNSVEARASGATEAARREATQSFFRLYMVPGMAHCAEGEGAVNFSTATRDSTPPVSDAAHDMAMALQAWVEKGQAPEALIATKYAEGNTHEITFQRPLCVSMKGTQTVFAGHSLIRRLRRAIQGYSEPDFDLPSRDADFVNDEAQESLALAEIQSIDGGPYLVGETFDPLS